MMRTKELAKSGAKHLCGSTEYGFMCGYNCGHKNKNEHLLDLYGVNETCPLEKYHVKEKSAERNSFGWIRNVTEEELFSICYECDFSTKTDTETVDVENVFRTHCIDCPVQSAYECMQEQRAEAMLS